MGLGLMNKLILSLYFQAYQFPGEPQVSLLLSGHDRYDFTSFISIGVL